jgi:hypothetical protein
MPSIPGTGRQLERLGEGTVFRSPSTTRRGLFHLTFVKANGEVRCSCDGFCFHGHCWHIDAIPLCMARSAELTENSVHRQDCWFVQGHSGQHSWGDGPVFEEPEPIVVQPDDPWKGLPGADE